NTAQINGGDVSASIVNSTDGALVVKTDITDLRNRPHEFIAGGGRSVSDVLGAQHRHRKCPDRTHTTNVRSHNLNSLQAGVALGFSGIDLTTQVVTDRCALAAAGDHECFFILLSKR